MAIYKTGQSDVGKRADIFIAEKLTDYSRASLKNLFKINAVIINNKPVKPAFKLNYGEKVAVNQSILDNKPSSLDLPIIFENQDVIVINKPAGILTHSKGAINFEPSVASFIADRLNDKDLKGNRAGIIHRLDRMTSGVIITAKNLKTLKYLQKQFSTRKVKKTYLAIVEGTPKENQAIIDMPIDRNPKLHKKFMVHPDGKRAQTKYLVQKTVEISGKNYSLLKIEPITGRTNQIRVHMAAINHPVVGDEVYGKENPAGLMLHAASLTINLPEVGRKTFSVPAPAKFREFIG